MQYHHVNYVALKYLDTELVQGFIINVMVLHINNPP